MPDKNSTGRMTALTIGAAASVLGIAAESASLSAQNAAEPTRTTTMNLSRDRPLGMVAAYTKCPKIAVSATRITETKTACRIRAPR